MSRTRASVTITREELEELRWLSRELLGDLGEVMHDASESGEMTGLDQMARFNAYALAAASLGTSFDSNPNRVVPVTETFAHIAPLIDGARRMEEWCRGDAESGDDDHLTALADRVANARALLEWVACMYGMTS